MTDELDELLDDDGAGNKAPWLDRMESFEGELKGLLNKYSMESASGTPDYVLATYLLDCWRAFNLACQRRDNFHGEQHSTDERFLARDP